MLIVGAFGYRRYTSFKVGTSLTQVSEFSLVLVSQGMLLGVVSKNAFSVVVMLAIVTITLTTYIFTHQLEIYKRIKHQLGFLEFPDHMHKTNHHYKVPASEIVLCGCDRMGRSILGKLTNDKKVPLVVDYNPKIISALNERHIPAMYGDITNEEILEHIDIKKVKILINTIKNQEASMLLLNEIRKRNKKLVFIDSAGKVNDALELYKNGADYVILPHFLSGDYISLLLSQKNLSRISVSRKNHIKELMKHQAHFLEDNHINEEHHVHD
jgi:Trk K+ transport system NAD-binding subunit